MSWKNILQCLAEGESETMEFLSSVQSTEHLLKHVVSFLNSNGGRIIIGIDDKNDHLIGSNVSFQFIENALQRIEPHIHIELEDISRLDKHVFYLKIPSGNMKPYSYRNAYYIRRSNQSTKLSKDEIFGLTVSQNKIALNERQAKCLEYLKENQIITNRKYRDLFMISHKTAHIELTALLNSGLIDKIGQGRNTSYKLP